MAGDLNLTEHLSILRPTEALLAGAAEILPIQFIHRYGDKVLIGLEPPQDTGTSIAATTEEAPHAAALEGLSEIERLGVAAFQLRVAPSFKRAKQQRPRDGQPWNMSGCTAIAQTLPPEASGALEAEASAPTSAFLEGSVAVGIIIVEGPNADLRFSTEERNKVVAEVQNGLSWLAAQNPAAGISFTYDIQTVTLTVAPNATASDPEALWRDPAMAALGYSADWAGVVRYVEDNRTRFRTRWTYVAFFTKYPVGHFAYASIGGPRLVMQYANDGWGPDNIDRVFTHETGHIFGAPDEYASSGCSCAGTWGRFGRPNTNCENCAPGGGIDCLMKANSFAMCNVTPAHLGWLTQFGAVRGNPVLLQGSFGANGNFELVVPAASGGGILFSWRNNDDAALPWSAPLPFGQAVGAVDALTMIQSNFGPGNLELIARVSSQLQFFWRDAGPAFRWNGPFPMFGGVKGNPVLIQSRFGGQGNFELVAPAASGGGMLFAWRNNDDGALPWSAPVRFGSGNVEEITLIQSNFGSPGNLELIARVGDQLHFYWRDSGPEFRWNGPFPMFGGVRGNPVLIQSRFGGQGNFELAAPAASGGGMLFAWRNNDDGALPWSAPVRFGSGNVEAITLIQSKFGSPGNLELIARVGDQLHFYWRDSGPELRWNGPFEIVTLPH
jgi:hypothetical protein